jgi:hypothetical protein
MQSVLIEADIIINGERKEAYGDAKTSFENIAAGWSVIAGVPLTGSQVALCMVWLKVCREAHSHKRDNLVDIAGYTALMEKLV